MREANDLVYQTIIGVRQYKMTLSLCLLIPVFW